MGVSYTGTGEDELLKKAKSGDINAFEELLTANYSFMISSARRILGNEEDVLDAVQEASFKIYLNLNLFRGECRFSSWVYKISKRCALDIRRKNNGRKTDSLDTLIINDKDFDVRSEEKTPIEKLTDKETSGIVREEVEAMPKEYKIVLELILNGKSYNEISEYTGKPIGTVKSGFFSGKRYLRDNLNLRRLVA